MYFGGNPGERLIDGRLPAGLVEDGEKPEKIVRSFISPRNRATFSSLPGATVDRHLSDQLVLYAALADGVSEYIVPSVTEHLGANCWLAAQFLGAAVEVADRRIRIRGIGYRKSWQRTG